MGEVKICPEKRVHSLPLQDFYEPVTNVRGLNSVNQLFFLATVVPTFVLLSFKNCSQGSCRKTVYLFPLEKGNPSFYNLFLQRFGALHMRAIVVCSIFSQPSFPVIMFLSFFFSILNNYFRN